MDSATNSSSFSYLIELRQRLLRALLVVVGLFVVLFSFSNELYHQLAAPLLQLLPKESQFIATTVTAPFLTPLKFTFIIALFLAVPVLLYEVWGFIAPALYEHERQRVAPLIIGSTLLFVLGIAFAYFVVLPLVFRFVVKATPHAVKFMPDINHYLNFCMRLFFAFGSAFQVPVATFLLIRTGVSTRESLAKKRPYVIVAAFTLGMFLTPPDVISQVLLAIPIWLLFEVGLIATRWIPNKKPETAPSI